ncbi:MAG: two-component sensor histidine kinase, partial [Proteobacteria bacterium]|nr:two-component sensor histidine kinase [Pseudomonadota bacterium]
MFWLEFTREFYRLAEEKKQAATVPVAPPAAVGRETAVPRTATAFVAFLDTLPRLDTLQNRVKELEAALAVSDRSREAFLSSMSHELRTPLNAIMGFSEMMKEGVFGELENPTYNAYAGHIHESGSSLLGKINDLLDIASLDAGG